MQIKRDTLVPGPPERAFGLVDDLTVYPVWMDLVHEVTVASPSSDDRLAWDVELQAQVGPFARSKRLRMVRTIHDAPHHVVFERDEIDGRRHSSWVLSATLVHDVPDAPGEAAVGTRLTMTLTYGGNLWTGAVLQRVLDDHVERGANALSALLADEDDRG